MVAWAWAGLFATVGVLMAALASGVGMRARVEVPLWLVLYGAWVFAVLWWDVPSPFWTVLVGGALAGLVAGVLQVAWMRSYLRNNPWYAAKLDAPPGELALGFVGFGLAAGTAVGLLFGALAWYLSDALP